MLIDILDGNGTLQRVIVQGQESPTDRSGLVLVTDVAQDVMIENADRSGWFLQNLGSNVMYVNDLGVAAYPIVEGTGSFTLQPGESFPPAGYAISTGPLSILGTADDVFLAREW